MLDFLILIFLVLRVRAASRKKLGEALHALLSLMLLVGLFLGFRVTDEVRYLLNELADAVALASGLGWKLALLVAAWYAMRLLRKRAGYWLEAAMPEGWGKPVTLASEALRSLLLMGFLVWLAESWFAEGGDAPYSVQCVRLIAGLPSILTASLH